MKICYECDYCSNKESVRRVTRCLSIGHLEFRETDYVSGYVTLPACHEMNEYGECEYWKPRRWLRWLVPRKGME